MNILSCVFHPSGISGSVTFVLLRLFRRVIHERWLALSPSFVTKLRRAFYSIRMRHIHLARQRSDCEWTRGQSRVVSLARRYLQEETQHDIRTDMRRFSGQQQSPHIRQVIVENKIHLFYHYYISDLLSLSLNQSQKTPVESFSFEWLISTDTLQFNQHNWIRMNSIEECLTDDWCKRRKPEF